MKHLLILLLLTFIAAFAQAQTKSQQRLLTLEQKRFEAMTNKDVNFLQSVLAEDLTYIHSNGLLESKEDHLTNISSGNIVYQKMKPRDVNIRVAGKTAIITGFVNVEGIYKTKEFNILLRYTDVYLKKNGKWMLTAWHSVRAD